MSQKKDVFSGDTIYTVCVSSVLEHDRHRTEKTERHRSMKTSRIRRVKESTTAVPLLLPPDVNSSLGIHPLRFFWLWIAQVCQRRKKKRHVLRKEMSQFHTRKSRSNKYALIPRRGRGGQIQWKDINRKHFITEGQSAVQDSIKSYSPFSSDLILSARQGQRPSTTKDTSQVKTRQKQTSRPLELGHAILQLRHTTPG